jgi:hypothetical protein
MFAPRLPAQLFNADIVPVRKSSHRGLPFSNHKIFSPSNHNATWRNPVATPSQLSLVEVDGASRKT